MADASEKDTILKDQFSPPKKLKEDVETFNVKEARVDLDVTSIRNKGTDNWISQIDRKVENFFRIQQYNYEQGKTLCQEIRECIPRSLMQVNIPSEADLQVYVSKSIQTLSYDHSGKHTDIHLDTYHMRMTGSPELTESLPSDRLYAFWHIDENIEHHRVKIYSAAALGYHMTFIEDSENTIDIRFKTSGSEVELYEESYPRRDRWAFYYQSSRGSTKYYLSLDEDDVVVAKAEPEYKYVWRKGERFRLDIRPSK